MDNYRRTWVLWTISILLTYSLSPVKGYGKYYLRKESVIAPFAEWFTPREYSHYEFY